MAAIYWDINAMTMLEKMLSEAPSHEDLKLYEGLWENTKYFVHKAVWDHAHPPVEEAISLRCAKFIKFFGWRFFTICAHAEAFLRACQYENDTLWEALTETMAKEKRSIDVFARTRGLHWRDPLLTVASQLPELESVLAPEPDLAVYPPGQVVITENGRLRLARFQGKTQAQIDKTFYDRDAYGGAPDPTLRKREWGYCSMCGDPEHCECAFAPDIGDLVELTEYQGKGIGIRALTNIKRGEILGNFIGEFVPQTDESYEWTIYDMELFVGSGGNPEEFLGTICPAYWGNWVRFINHSCDQKTDFILGNLGKHATVLVQAVRDIPIFEEITVNYGVNYWKGRKCLCGSANCMHRDAQGPKESSA